MLEAGQDILYNTDKLFVFEVNTMPFVSIHVSNSLSDAQKDEIKSGVGKAISLIPGKIEKVLMVDISDKHDMYFGGVKQENCAYADIKLYGETDFEDKKAFTEALFKIMKDAAAVENHNMFVTFSEFAEWGTKGSLK